MSDQEKPQCKCGHEARLHIFSEGTCEAIIGRTDIAPHECSCSRYIPAAPREAINVCPAHGETGREPCAICYPPTMSDQEKPIEQQIADMDALKREYGEVSMRPTSDPIEDMAGKAAEEWIPTTSHFPLADATRSALAAIIARHYRELLATQKKVCSVCWTSSFDPCEGDTPDAYEDGRGGWMVCAMCQTIHAAAEREKQVRELVLAARTILDDNTTTMQHVTDRQRLRTILEQFRGVK